MRPLPPYLMGLGLVAKSQRNIQPGTQYNDCFDAPPLETTVLSDGMETIPTVETIGKMAHKYAYQCKKIATRLKGRTNEETLRNIFNFCYNHIQYELDADGVEQLRTPNRIWADKKADCDCFTFFISCMLVCLGMPHKYRVVKLRHKPNYQHIYVVVHKNPSSNLGPTEGTSLGTRSHYWVVDPVVDHFDEEPGEITYKHDHAMIPVHLLNGLNGLGCPRPTATGSVIPVSNRCLSGLGSEFDNLGSLSGGLGCPADMPKPQHNQLLCKEFSGRVKQHLQNTIAEMRKELNAGNKEIDLQLIMQMERIVSVWDNPEMRLATIVSTYKGSAPTAKTFFQALAMHAAIDAKGLEGLGAFKEWWRRNIGQPTNRAFQKLEDVFDNVWADVKDFSKNAGEKLKKMGKFLLRWNPLSALGRIGVLTLISRNYKNLSGDAMLYYNNPDWKKAKQAGAIWANWHKSKTTYDKLRYRTVNLLKATEHEFIQALVHRKFVFGQGNDADAVNVQAAFEYGAPLLVGTLQYNYYGETNEARLSPGSIVVTDAMGENGWVVLFNGIPSIEVVALKIDVPAGADPNTNGNAYAMDLAGNYWETNNGSWFAATYPGQPIPPFSKFADRFYWLDANGQPTALRYPETQWVALHKAVYNQEKAKANPNDLFSRPAPPDNQNSTNPGTSNPGTSNPGGLLNLVSNMSGLGAVSEALLITAISAGVTILEMVVGQINKDKAPEEPTDGGYVPPNPDMLIQDPDNPNNFKDPITGQCYDKVTMLPVECKKASSNMPLILGGLALLGIGAAFLMADTGKKGLGCTDPEPETVSLPETEYKVLPADHTDPLSGTSAKKTHSRKAATPAQTRKKNGRVAASRTVKMKFN